MQLVCFWLALSSAVTLVLVSIPGVFSLVLVGTVWCIQFGPGWHCLVHPVWSWLVLYSAVSLALFGTVWCIQFGSGWHCLVQLVWSWLALFGAVSLVQVGTV